MSRGLNADFENAIGGAVFYGAVFLELHFISGYLRLWTGLGSKTFQSNTYTGTGSLLRLEQWEESTSLRLSALTVSLSGLDSTILGYALSESRYQGRSANLWINAMDEAGASSTVINSTQIIEGLMDQLKWTDNGADGVNMSLSIENRWNDLFRPRLLLYNDQDQKTLFPRDDGFEYVASLQTKATLTETSDANVGTVGGSGANSGGRGVFHGGRSSIGGEFEN
jgi:hypothetical protein